MFKFGLGSTRNQLKLNQGFTLVELLVGASMTGVVLAMTGFGMVALMQNDRRNEEQSAVRANLNRALDFISDDIRSAATVSTTAPGGWTTPSGYQLVLYISKPSPNIVEPTVTQVAYYTRVASGTVWRNPQVIYRSTASGSGGEALIDAISSTAPDCTYTGSGVTDSGTSKGGFRALVQNNRNVKLCILGNLTQSNTTTYRAETLAAVRSGT